MSKIKTVANGASWGVFASGFSTLLKFATIPILARMLTPEDFGAVAVAMVVIMFFSLLGGKGGLSAALIYEHKCTQLAWNSALLTNFFIGIVGTLILFICAQEIAELFGASGYYQILQILSLIIPLQFMNDIFSAKLFKELRFKTESKILSISDFISVLIAIVLAFDGAGVWALVAQHVVANLLRLLLLLYTTTGWSLSYSFKEVRVLYKFSLQTFWVEIANFISFYSPIVIASKVIGVSASGDISVKNRITALPGDIIQQGIAKVLFPIFVSTKDKGDQKELLLWSIWINSILMMPMLVGLAIISESVSKVLLGHNFQAEWLALSFLALSRAITAPCAGMNPYLKGVGQIRLLLIAFIIRASLVLLFCFFGATNFGLIGLTLALVGTSFISFFILFYFVMLTSELTFSELIEPTKKPCYAILFMSLTTGLFVFYCDKGFIEMLIGFSIGLLSYLSALYILYPELRKVTSLSSLKTFFMKF